MDNPIWIIHLFAGFRFIEDIIELLFRLGVINLQKIRLLLGSMINYWINHSIVNSIFLFILAVFIDLEFIVGLMEEASSFS